MTELHRLETLAQPRTLSRSGNYGSSDNAETGKWPSPPIRITKSQPLQTQQDDNSLNSGSVKSGRTGGSASWTTMIFQPS